MNVHYIDSYLSNPTHPITIKLIGVGGTGSQVLIGLARMNQVLLALGHKGLFVTAYDPDTVTAGNIGRQLFFPADVGRNKAIVLIERVNRAYGTAWTAIPKLFEQVDVTSRLMNVLITCLDKGVTRKLISKWLGQANTKKGHEPFDHYYYWLDMGNARNSGQVVLGSREIVQPTSSHTTIAKLQTIVDLYPNIADFDDQDQGPTCSAMESLNRQGLYINTLISTFGLDLFWTLLHKSRITHHGLYYNGDTMQINPITL